MSRATSAAVMTVRTPGRANAAAQSIDRMCPCATELRRITACNAPSHATSSTNLPRPLRNRKSSMRSIGLPIRKFAVRILLKRGSINLHAGSFDHLAPFHPLSPRIGRELIRRGWRRLGSDVLELLRDLRLPPDALHIYCD